MKEHMPKSMLNLHGYALSWMAREVDYFAELHCYCVFWSENIKEASLDNSTKKKKANIIHISHLSVSYQCK